MPQIYLGIPPEVILNSLHNLENSLVFSCQGFASHSAELTEYDTPDLMLLMDPIDKTRASIDFFTQQLAATANMNKPTSSHPRIFHSGWAGLINYPASAHSSPSCEFNYYDLAILVDRNKNDCLLISHKEIPQKRVKQIKERIKKASSLEVPPAQKRKWDLVWSQEDYGHAFMQVKEYLASGDCYQTNLTMPFRCSDNIRNNSPLPLFEKFKAPYACHMKAQDKTIFSVTPERFMKVENKIIETSPIKGTIARGNTNIEDKENIAKLTQSQKDKAENLMIVDLLRNDLSKSAKPNSVKVDKLFELESHANVHHLVSTISAQLKKEVSPFEAIAQAFPGGSITGAPKHRAMEIIDELEHMPRDAYCGSIGFIDDSGYCDFNILIRTIIARDNGAICWGGGGVVTDSTLDSEYEEIFSKVQMIMDTPL